MNAVKPTWLIYGIGIVLSWWIGYNYVHAPQQRQVRLIHTQIAQEQQLQRTQAEVADLLLQIDRYRKRLPEEPDPSWIVRDLVTLAQQAGIQLTSITQEAPQPSAQQLTRVAVAVQFSASYHQLGTFLDAIERSKRFIRVERLNIARVDPAASHAPIQLVLSTMYFPPLTNERPPMPAPVAGHAPASSSGQAAGS